MDVLSLAWGTVPDWLGAVGSIAAASVAVYLAYREGQRADNAEADSRQLRQRLEREQAAKVAAWVEAADENGHHVWVIQVKNSSSESVYSVALRLLDGERELGLLKRRWWDVLPPGDTVLTVSYEGAGCSPHAVVSFTDGAGLRWERGLGGVLRRL